MHQFEEIVALFDITGKLDRVITDNATIMRKAFCYISTLVRINLTVLKMKIRMKMKYFCP